MLTGTFPRGTAFRLLLTASLCLALCGCGRRGAPELPPSATVVVTDEQGNPVERTAEPVDRPFVLDPLIQ